MMKFRPRFGGKDKGGAKLTKRKLLSKPSRGSGWWIYSGKINTIKHGIEEFNRE